ncbi:MAG: hypothetical protein EOP45_18175 [Sphingobacteriaceae bacterium]|nr:MAG: hypothetical protein EOP45_18175 [Sphingobacteriaceae bacterium]
MKTDIVKSYFNNGRNENYKKILMGWLIFTIVLILCRLMVDKYNYTNIFLLSLNGRIEAKRTDIKEIMYVTVDHKEHDLGHHWPSFHKQAEIGDSIYKQPRKYDIILVKKLTNQKIFCKSKPSPCPLTLT